MKKRRLAQRPQQVARKGRVGQLVYCVAAALALFGMAGVWSPVHVQAQESPKKKAPVVQAKAKAKSTTPAPVVVNFPGKGQNLDHAALAKIIDQEINKRLKEDKVPASALASDAEFLRRVYVDIVGVIPPADKVVAFLQDASPNKRAKVIDELLADSRFGTSQGEIWSGHMLPRKSNNRRLDHTPFQQWLAKEFNANTPLDKFAYEILTASGEQDKNGAVTYFVGNPTVDKMNDNVAKVFMGIQLQCAQCHNHPFTDYKQNDYWGMAAFFMKVRPGNPNQAAKKGVAPGVTEAPTAITKGKGLPEAAKILPPKFLQAEAPKVGSTDPYRPVLAKWLTSPDNPFFTKAMANRFWHHFFGRGIVNPVDDMHDDNQPSHPELLAALSEQLRAHKYDLKYLIRAICNSEAYQRTSQPLADNKDDTELYSHRVIRVLSPEQLYDSLYVAMNNSMPTRETGRVATVGNKKGGAKGGREAFLNFFRIEEGNDPLEYQAGIPQALRLMNSAQLNNFNQAIAQASKTAKNPQETIESLYLMTLSRKPSQQETTRMQEYVTKAGDSRTGFSDVLWALLNSSEFALNH